MITISIKIDEPVVINGTTIQYTDAIHYPISLEQFAEAVQQGTVSDLISENQIISDVADRIENFKQAILNPQEPE